MRIIAGEFRSRRLHTPKDASTTRPMPDYVRESLFGILRGNCEGAIVLDAFAGTGSVGLEAISRGAQRCVFIERERTIAQILRRNIEDLGVEDRCEVVEGDALGLAAVARCPNPVDLVFLDPPYPLVQSEAGWRRVKDQTSRFIERLSPDGFAVVRTPWPFFHADDESPPPGSRLHARRDARRQARERLRIEAQLEHGDSDDVDVASAPPRRADLTISGAIGPETHPYRTTALHLYMRRT